MTPRARQRAAQAGRWTRAHLPSGSMQVVPQGHWHRVHADESVIPWGVTPGESVQHEGAGLPAR